MKKQLFFLLLGLNFAFAQQKVFFKSDYEKSFGSIRTLQKSHNALDSYDGNSNERVLENERFAITLGRLARSKNIRFSEFGLPYRMEVLVFSEGDEKIEKCVYNFFQTKFEKNRLETKDIDSISVEIRSKIELLLTEMTETYQLKSLAMRPFYLTVGFSFGKNARQNVSKKAISSIEQAKATTRPDTVKIVNFTALNLREIPQEIYRFKNLEELILKENELKSIPKEVFKLKKLKMLDVSKNELRDSSVHFARNKHLKVLNLQANEFSMLPYKIQKNRRLENLLLGNNQLLNFDKSNLKRLTKLSNLNLYNADLNELPKNITQLENLEELDLYHNNLRLLPNEVTKLSNLKTLAVSNNQLWKLPENISLLKNLKVLYAHHNKLSDLPQLPDLKLLDVGYNLFKTLPNSIQNLQNIEELDFMKNQISEVPTVLQVLPKLKKAYVFGNEYNRNAGKETEFRKLYEELEKKGISVK